MIMALGAVISGYLGFRLYELWVPTAVACTILAVQYAMFQVGNSSDVGVELYASSFALSIVLCYATYSIGRAIGQRRKAKR